MHRMSSVYSSDLEKRYQEDNNAVVLFTQLHISEQMHASHTHTPDHITPHSATTPTQGDPFASERRKRQKKGENTHLPIQRYSHTYRYTHTCTHTDTHTHTFTDTHTHTHTDTHTHTLTGTHILAQTQQDSGKLHTDLK